MAEARAVIFCIHMGYIKTYKHLDYKLSLEWAWPLSRDIFNFSEISDNISEMVQDRDIVTI